MKRFILIFSILIFSFLLSSSSPNLHRFDVDHDAHFVNIKTHIDSNTLPLIGTTNSFINIGPMEYYLYMGIQYFNPDPIFSIYFGVFLYLIGLLLLFKTLELLINDKRILYLTFLLASFDPFLIWISRDCTNVSFFFPAAALILYGIFSFINKKSDIYIIYSITGLLIIIQSHLTGIIFTLPIIILLYKNKINFSSKLIFLPMIIIIIFYLPWIGNEFITGFSDILHKIDISSIKTETSSQNNEIITNIFHQGYHIDSVNSENIDKLYKKLPYLSYKNNLLMILFTFSIIVLIFNFFMNLKKRDIKFETNSLLLIIFFVNSLFITLTAPKFAARYMLIFYPLYFLIIGFSFQIISDLLKKKWRFLSSKISFSFSILIVFIIFLNISYILSWRNSVSKTSIIKGDLTLEKKKEIIKRLVNINNFTPNMIKHNFHNLYTSVHSGYKYLSLIYGKNNHKNLDNIRAYLVKKGEFPKIIDRFSISNNMELLMSSSGFKNNILFSHDNKIFNQDTLPIYIENQGEYSYLKCNLHVEETKEISIGIISRAIPETLHVDNNLKYKIKIKKRKIVRESLPITYIINCGTIIPGIHDIKIKLFLNDLWSKIEIFDIP